MSMNYGEHKVPDPFQDEDKWGGLTKRQLFILIPSALISIGICVLSFQLHILPVGIVLATILMLIAVAFMIFKVPSEKYLFGSELRPEVLLLRILYKQLPMNKKIYTRFYDKEHREW